jgi:hypothetical protein
MLPIVRNGLVLELHFNELTGSTVYDLSDYNNNGTISGATRVQEGFNRALWFDGIDDYVNVPHSESLDIRDELTVVAWVRFDYLDYVNGSGKLQAIAGKGCPDTLAPNYGWWFVYDNRNNRKSFNYTCFGNSAGGYAGGGNNFGASVYDYVFEVGKFYQLAFTVTTTEARLFINGKQQGPTKSISNLQLSDTTRPLRIGQASTTGIYFNGVIDEVLVYNRALSESEIKAIYNYYMKKRTLER